MQTLVVTEKGTDKLICMIPLESNRRSVVGTQYAIEMYQDVLPVLKEKDGYAYIKRNHVILNREGAKKDEKEN